MTLERKPLHEMNQDSLGYLANNTPITFLNDGGIAVSLVKAANREIAQLQDLTTTLFRNARPSSANGVFLDMIGELLSVKRLPASAARVDRGDGAIRFYTEDGSLGSYLPHPSDASLGLIPNNTRMTTSDGLIVYRTIEDTEFPRGAVQVYVSAESVSTGSEQSIGSGKLTSHSLGAPAVLVTNDRPITTARDVENDQTYRFRLSNAVLSLAGGNRSAVESSVLSFPGVQTVQIREYVRGTGTFDVFVVPVHNKLGSSTKRQIQTTINRTKALGIDAKVREPDYVPICMAIQLSFYENVPTGQREVIKRRVSDNVKDYLESIPLGGEFIINQVRSAVLSSSPREIRDMRLIELCFKGRPMIRRNIRLAPEELLILDENRVRPIDIV